MKSRVLLIAAIVVVAAIATLTWGVRQSLQQPVKLHGDPVIFTVSPGEKRIFFEALPPETNLVGVLADYYRAPGDPEGTRLQVVPARCGLRKPALVLSPKDMYHK